MDTAIAMPIRLSLEDVAGSLLYGRLVFLVDTTGRAPVPQQATTAEVFGRGLGHLLGNYLSAFHIRGGLAALCDDTTFLLAVRALADDLYGAAGPAASGLVVDASSGNARAPQVIEALFPDARIVVVEESPSPVTDLLQSPLVARVTPDAFTKTGLDAVLATRPVPVAEPNGAQAPRDELREPPVFVVGCPRSGTTWLQHLLTAHPDLAGPDKETAAFMSVQELLGNTALAAEIGDDAVREATRRFLSGLFARHLRVTQATRFLEKTPLHALHLDTIASLYPEAAVIGIHRDGRDVVRSLLQVDAGARDAKEAATTWVAATTAVEAFVASHPHARDERYEELLADPVVGTVDLLAWLGLPPTPEVVEDIRKRAGTRVSQYNTTGAVGAGKWRDMDAADLRATYRVAGDRLVRLGYLDEVPTERASVLERFRRRVRSQ